MKTYGEAAREMGGDPYVFYLLLFKKIEMLYKNRLICLAK